LYPRRFICKKTFLQLRVYTLAQELRVVSCTYIVCTYYLFLVMAIYTQSGSSSIGLCSQVGITTVRHCVTKFQLIAGLSLSAYAIDLSILLQTSEFCSSRKSPCVGRHSSLGEKMASEICETAGRRDCQFDCLEKGEDSFFAYLIDPCKSSHVHIRLSSHAFNTPRPLMFNTSLILQSSLPITVISK